MDAFLNHMWECVCNVFSFLWSVVSFWAVWQVCDFGLSRLKIKLRKPWVVQEEGLPKRDDGVQ